MKVCNAPMHLLRCFQREGQSASMGSIRADCHAAKREHGPLFSELLRRLLLCLELFSLPLFPGHELDRSDVPSSCQALPCLVEVASPLFPVELYRLAVQDITYISC